MTRVEQFDWEGFRRLIDDLAAVVPPVTHDGALETDRSQLAVLSRVFCAGASMPSSDEVYEQLGGDAFCIRSEARPHPRTRTLSRSSTVSRLPSRCR